MKEEAEQTALDLGEAGKEFAWAELGHQGGR